MTVLIKGKAMQGKLFSSKNIGSHTEKNGTINKSTTSLTNPHTLVYQFVNGWACIAEQCHEHITCTMCTIKIQD